MPRKTPTEKAVPPAGNLAALRKAASACRACKLWERATQTVFGAGPSSARMLLVGEQPGDREDREGKPFVGPAGTLLDEALAAAGIERSDVYLTNVVKHFGWEPRGKRRLHSRPRPPEIAACSPWLDAEIRALRPRVIVCLGATATHALLGPAARVTSDRGKPVASSLAPYVVPTMHPSAILRMRGTEARAEGRAALVADLRVAAQLLVRA